MQKYAAHINTTSARKIPTNERGKAKIAISFMPRLNMTVFCTKARTVAVIAITNTMLIRYGQLSKKKQAKAIS